MSYEWALDTAVLRYLTLCNGGMTRHGCQRVLPNVRLCQVVGLQTGFRHHTDTAEQALKYQPLSVSMTR